jgi:hypothetical protein
MGHHQSIAELAENVQQAQAIWPAGDGDQYRSPWV